MIFFAVLLAIGDPPPLSLEPFMDEERAALAMEGHLICLGKGAFERRADKRDPKNVADDVVAACATESAQLQTALVDVYQRKPQLMPAGQTPTSAATFHVSEMNKRIELVIREYREKK